MNLSELKSLIKLENEARRRELEESEAIVGNALHGGSSLVEGALMPVCVDFDGTLVEHRYPDIGDEVPHCVEVLRKWMDGGVGIILDTMRCGADLEAAVAWCESHGIKLYGVGKCPGQERWTTSGKAYAVFSVDDRNLGVPVIKPKEGDGRPYVDWEKVDEKYTSLVLGMVSSFKEGD